MSLKRLAATVLAGLVLFVQPAANAATQQPTVKARAAILINGATGQVLYQQNAQNTNFPASITKLLTALVAVEQTQNLDKVVTVSANAASPRVEDESSCYIYEGEKQSIRNLLYGLLLSSGNDCAVAIAEGVAGSEAKFVELMNQTAVRVGATKSHFMNAHGLHDDKHYTTAFDYALIAKAALSNGVVADIAKTFEFDWKGKLDAAGKPIPGPYYNHNKLLGERHYDGALGGKTGYTEQALPTLVASAKRGDLYVIGVVLGAETSADHYIGMKDMFDYGFENFEMKPVVAAGNTQGQLTVLGGASSTVAVQVNGGFNASVPKGGNANLTLVPKMENTVTAPVKAGQKVGILEVRDGDRVLQQLDLLAASGVDILPPTAAANVLDWSMNAGKWLLYTLVGLFAFRTVVLVVRRTLRGRRRRDMRMRANRRAHSIRYYRSHGD